MGFYDTQEEEEFVRLAARGSDIIIRRGFNSHVNGVAWRGRLFFLLFLKPAPLPAFAFTAPMASSSHGETSRSRRKRSFHEDLPALPAPKRSLAPQQELLALPAPSTPRARSRYPQAGEPAFELNILLPDGGHIVLHEKIDEDLGVEELLLKVRRIAAKGDMRACSVKWGPHVYLEDAASNRVEDGHIFDSEEFSRILFLQDGQPHSIHSLQDMWNVTPDPELLVSLPQEYTVETALADLLDNSLQAVWANLRGERRLISVWLKEDKITIFDSGPGMDSTSENSIAKWGTMGSSKHRSRRAAAVGGKPPFLQPFFGMYGFGGLTAAMHLGGVAVVSSKTKASKKVVSLTLEKEKLMERCKTDRSWKTAGEYREPTEEELKISPHGSFTKVELSKLKEGIVWTEKQVMCMLKDIYFPYIQCDVADSSQGTMMPVEFEVNETNLTEVDGGEVALTNLSSCTGSPFIIDIQMKRISQHSDPSLLNELDQANARIKCFYFPIRQGKESIDIILEELQNGGIKIKETFDNFCRVSIRRLGRLLPDARWRRLPFMERKRKRGDKVGLPKICFERVKASIDTDAGFIPTTSKMDLLSGHVFTNVLRNLGTRGNIPGDVSYEIYRGPRQLKLPELEKEYEDWIVEMHDAFDEEVECDDEPDVIATERAPLELGFSQNVYRIYSSLTRKGVAWKQGMKIRFSKGVPGYKSKDFYATLEFFLSDGLSEDKGNTKVICRPMEIAKAEGSRVILVGEEVGFELQKSKAVPIEYLTSDKCEVLHDRDWMRICDNKRLHEPGDIDILDKKIIESLGLSGGIAPVVKAGVRPFEHIYAVIRPNSYLKLVQDGKILGPLDQKNIVKKSMEMKLEIRRLILFNPYTSDKASQDDLDTDSVTLCTEQSINNIHGFYCFSMDKTDFRRFYTKAGKYALTFYVIDEGSLDPILEKTLEVSVSPSDKVCRWILKDVAESEIPSARLGSEIGPVILHCLDEYNNLKDIDWPCDSRFEVWSCEKKLEIDLLINGFVQQEKKKTSLIIKAITLTGGSLRSIAEDYFATLKLIIGDKSVASMDIRVLPGEMSSIHVLNIDDLDNCLQTGDIIHALTFQVMDKFGNHVERGCEVFVQLDNLELQDSQGHDRMVDDKGCIKLGGLLKVTGPFNARAKICVYTKNQKLIYFKDFFLKRRMLQVVSVIPEECATSGVLRNVAVEVVDENGNIDSTMTGGQHLIIVSCAQQSAYPLREGTCCINSIQLPDEPGPWCCNINHVMYEELEAEIKLNLVANSGHSMDFPDFIENDEGATLELPDKSGSFPELEKLSEGILERIDDLKRKMAYCVQKVKNAEIELEKLNERMNMEADSIAQLEGETESLHTQAESLQKSSLANGHDKNDITAEKIAEEISRTNFPAKFLLEAFCTDSFLSAKTGNPHISDILGIVCLLGSAKEEALSRALADFIGEESLLAVVCKTQEAADLLIRLNQSDGSIDESWGLYDYIKSQRLNIHGKLRIFILEDMRWYNEDLDESHPQKLLTMNQPTLNGCVPNGFLGYAVNLIQMNDEHLQLRVGGEDHGGLRGSLFYNLFKNLQVYDTRKNLFRAKGALTTGGVSLDGGLIRDKGYEEFGQWQKAKILFPIHSKAGKRIPSLRSINHITQAMQIRDALKEKRHELQDCKMRLDQTKGRIDYVKRRIKSREAKFESTMAEMEKSKEELAQITKSMRSL